MTETGHEMGLEQLKRWQMAMEFAVKVCRDLIPSLPDEERYALTNQFRRSAQSIPSNIAEGYGRYYYQEEIRFCYIARGSVEETRSHITFALKMGYLTETRVKFMKNHPCMKSPMIRSLRKRFNSLHVHKYTHNKSHI
jgi:four helix bundle protein